jgi:hypothetical protein
VTKNLPSEAILVNNLLLVIDEAEDVGCEQTKNNNLLITLRLSFDKI